MQLSERETATILAALRFMQRQPVLPTEIAEIASSNGAFVPIDDDDIDHLCERLNFGDDIDDANDAARHAGVIPLNQRT